MTSQRLSLRANELGLVRLAQILANFGTLPAGELVRGEIPSDVAPHVAAFDRLARGVPGPEDVSALLTWLASRTDERALFAWDLLHNQIAHTDLELARLRTLCRDVAPRLPRGARRAPRHSLGEMPVGPDLAAELEWLRHLQRARLSTWCAAHARAVFEQTKSLEAAAIWADELADESSWGNGWGSDDFPTSRRALRELLDDRVAPVDNTTLVHYVRLRLACSTFDTASLNQLLTVDVPRDATEAVRARATFAWAEAHVRTGKAFLATDALAELARRTPAFEYGRWVLLLTLTLDPTVHADNLVKAVDHYLQDFGPRQRLFVELFRYARPGANAWLGPLLRRLVGACEESADASVWAGACMAFGEGDEGTAARNELLEKIEGQLPAAA